VDIAKRNKWRIILATKARVIARDRPIHRTMRHYRTAADQERERRTASWPPSCSCALHHPVSSFRASQPNRCLGTAGSRWISGARTWVVAKVMPLKWTAKSPRPRRTPQRPPLRSPQRLIVATQDDSPVTEVRLKSHLRSPNPCRSPNESEMPAEPSRGYPGYSTCSSRLGRRWNGWEGPVESP
jgi:hypothetical protein